MKIVICGIGGKMGRRILTCALDEGLEVVGGTEPVGSALSGEKIDGIQVYGELSVALTNEKPDAVIDFSATSAAAGNAAACSAAGVPLIVGTTGLKDEEQVPLAEAAKKIPVVFASNMSIGVNLLFKLVKEVSGILPESYNIEIVETHHRMKKDAPSGTAKTLLERAAEGRNWDAKKVANPGRDGMVGARPDEEIGILAVRGGDIVGEHTVTFAGPGERLELIHRAHSRDVFARGSLKAARWIVKEKPGLYDMQDVLGLK